MTCPCGYFFECKVWCGNGHETGECEPVIYDYCKFTGCVSQAKHRVYFQCTGCPTPGTRSQVEYMCKKHLAQCVKGDAVCSVCSKKITVTNYTTPGEREPDAQPVAQRITDAARNTFITQLGDAYADGRLTYEEFSQRSEKAAFAKVQGDLDTLTADIMPVTQEVAHRYPAWVPIAIAVLIILSVVLMAVLIDL